MSKQQFKSCLEQTKIKQKRWQYSSSWIVLENNVGHISMNDLMTLSLVGILFTSVMDLVWLWIVLRCYFEGCPYYHK